jgi:hypothetical protein
VHAKIAGAEGSDELYGVFDMLSNMSSSDLSSPMHNTKPGGFPLSIILERTFSATNPLVTPCTFLRSMLDHFQNKREKINQEHRNKP